jgi:spermidine/putrescine-binding protein
MALTKLELTDHEKLLLIDVIEMAKEFNDRKIKEEQLLELDKRDLAKLNGITKQLKE